MRANYSDKRVGVSNTIMKVVSILIAIVYLSFGLWFVLSEQPISNIALKTQRIIGGIAIAYSVFRGYVIYLRYFKRRNSNVESE